MDRQRGEQRDCVDGGGGEAMRCGDGFGDFGIVLVLGIGHVKAEFPSVPEGNLFLFAYVPRIWINTVEVFRRLDRADLGTRQVLTQE